MKSKVLTILFLLIATISSAQSWVTEDFQSTDTAFQLISPINTDSTVTVWTDWVSISGKYFRVVEQKLMIDTPIIVRMPVGLDTLRYKNVQIKYFKTP